MCAVLFLYLFIFHLNIIVIFTKRTIHLLAKDDGKSQTKSGQMLVCYLNALSLDKATRKNNFNLNVIDPFLCSHIIISIAKISPSTDELALANDFDFG